MSLKYLIPVVIIIAGVIGVIILLHQKIPTPQVLESPTAQRAECCKECTDAFAQSPVDVGPEGASCGGFPTGKPLSIHCADYFAKHPLSVSDCGK